MKTTRRAKLISLLLFPLLLSCTIISGNQGQIYLDSIQYHQRSEVLLYGIKIDTNTKSVSRPPAPAAPTVIRLPSVSSAKVEACPKFELPLPTPMPESIAEQIHSLDRSDPKALDMLTVKYIQALIETIKDQRAALHYSYEAYLEKCKGNTK